MLHLQLQLQVHVMINTKAHSSRSFKSLSSSALTFWKRNPRGGVGYYKNGNSGGGLRGHLKFASTRSRSVRTSSTCSSISSSTGTLSSTLSSSDSKNKLVGNQNIDRSKSIARASCESASPSPSQLPMSLLQFMQGDVSGVTSCGTGFEAERSSKSVKTRRCCKNENNIHTNLTHNQYKYYFSYQPIFNNRLYLQILVRNFSNNNTHDTDKNSSTETDSTTHQQNIQVVDKEFVNYLTGNFDGDENTNDKQQQYSQNHDNIEHDQNDYDLQQEPQSPQQEQQQQSPQLKKPSSTTTPDYFHILFHNKSTSTDDNSNPTTQDLNETYEKIQLTQSINIEKSRKRRLITVRRALGGNVIIALSKLAAFLHSGSSAMMSEFIHSVVDCGNQSLLLVGLHDSGIVADRSHPYGYGKSIYFWALVSALGTFFLGAGVSMTQALPNLIYGNDSLHEITWHVWSVLGFSFAVDGYVFTRTLMEVNENKPDNVTLFKHIYNLRDPATLAILLEDGAACLGVVMAIGGLGLTQAFDMPIYDALAGVGIGGLLASMGVILVRVNHRFLLGQSVDKEIRVGIEKILLNRKSIDAVHSVQSQWTGAETFSFKAEVDFDGTFLAAKLMPRYQQEFAEARSTLDQDLRVLLSWYAEDVMRTVEREVRSIEAEIRKEYPGAQYIELEPMSKDADRFAIDDGLEASLKRIEIESLNRYLKSLYEPELSKVKPISNSNSEEEEKDHDTTKR